MTTPPKILFALTGSIACYKACEAISTLVQRGCEVQVVVSPSVAHFVGNATLEGLTGRRVLGDIWEAGEAMQHIQLVRWCDVMVLCPATAHSINRLAAGMADDMLGALYLAKERTKPFIVFPAMNAQMWAHPATQKSAEILHDHGALVAATGEGNLACGEVGAGRLLEPLEIVEQILSLTQPSDRRRGRVLITSGGTREHIDDVRFIANGSTGQTGAFLADRFVQAGFDVTYIGSVTAAKPKRAAQVLPFESFNDLEGALFNELRTQNFDIVIHAAAVSDYSVQRVLGKMDSSQDELTLHLSRNPKLVDLIKNISRNKRMQLVAFKLTSAADEFTVNQNVMALFERSRADYVVHNDLINMKHRDTGQHPGTIYISGGDQTSFESESQMADLLLNIFADLEVSV
jgi:phosphopantothenoylcysteine decarboxylase/phosphopantothenate--cysteine ligase